MTGADDGWVRLYVPPRLPLALLSGDEPGLVDPALLATEGPHLETCRSLLADHLGGATTFLTPSCTDALELAALLTEVGPGDEVVVPTFTFPSTASAFALRGARLRFADVRPDTLNLDEAGLADRCTDRTRAVVAVHYAGVACEMDELTRVARAADLVVVEDAAHALFGCYRGRPLGTLGQVGTLSFHRTKNLAVGEGGALVVNDRAWVPRAETLVAKGTDRAAFARGEVDVYTWQDAGTAGLMTELVAALLEPQLRGWAAVQARRLAVWDRYQTGLAGWAGSHGVRLPSVPEGIDPAAHLYWMVLPDEAARRRLEEHLAARRIEAVYHYQPLHTSPMGRRLGGRPGDCPVAEQAAGSLVRLPLHDALTDAEVDRVIEGVLAFAP